MTMLLYSFTYTCMWPYISYSSIFYQAIVDLENKITCMNGNNSWPPVVCSGFYKCLHIRIELTLGVKLRDNNGPISGKNNIYRVVQ
jgi:hypothetical protein